MFVSFRLLGVESIQAASATMSYFRYSVTGIEKSLQLARAALRVRETPPPSSVAMFEDTVATFEEAARIARRVFGGAHPLVAEMELTLQNARAALRTRETPPPSSPSGDV